MTRRFSTWMISAIAIALPTAGRLPAHGSIVEAAAQSAPTEVEVQALLTERLLPKTDTGIVVGIVGPGGRRIVAAGKAGPGAVPSLDARTTFEIGSATKVFTAALLMDMVRRGEVSLTDPVAKYLPESVKVPARGGRQITLVDLATHTSGLPRLPSNLKPKDASNPYADYSVAQLYEFLSHYELTRDIGAQYEYSNLGMGLLGHALALKGGTGYETLVRTRILEPLRMRDTAITLSPALRSRLAAGHDARGSAVANWDIPTLAGAGRCVHWRISARPHVRDRGLSRGRPALHPGDRPVQIRNLPGIRNGVLPEGRRCADHVRARFKRASDQPGAASERT